MTDFPTFHKLVHSKKSVIEQVKAHIAEYAGSIDRGQPSFLFTDDNVSE